jgi:glycosyltransferase involved in cell wall biosynthesis
LIEDRMSGCFVPVGNEIALAEALEGYRISEDSRSKAGLSARRFIEKSYSLSEMTKKYMELYSGL